MVVGNLFILQFSESKLFTTLCPSFYGSVQKSLEDLTYLIWFRKFSIMELTLVKAFTEPAITFSKLTIEELEKGEKYV